MNQSLLRELALLRNSIGFDGLQTPALFGSLALSDRIPNPIEDAYPIAQESFAQQLGCRQGPRDLADDCILEVRRHLLASRRQTAR